MRISRRILPITCHSVWLSRGVHTLHQCDASTKGLGKDAPKVCDDPNNPPGNELGYVVNFSYCIDAQVPADAIRLEKGDSLTLTTNYDVDEKSTRGYPFPGGKHGGVMGLFFYQIDCDDDAVAAGFACRQGDCISVPKGKNTSEFDTLGDCLSKCK